MKSKAAFALSLVMAIGCVFAETADIVTVKGRGVGEDMASALKDAYRDAIETAVGLYVDAEQMVKNDELLKDQVLTQSNAYIEGYDVLSKKVGDGMISIKIIAKVKTRPLAKKVSGFMKPRTVEVGSALRDQFAKSATERKRGEEGAALVNKALAGVNVELQSMDCWLAYPDGIVGNDDGKSPTVSVDYLLGYRINEERFFNLMLSLCDVFDQVAIEEPADILIPVDRGSPFDIQKFLKSKNREQTVKLSPNPSFEYCGGCGNFPKEPYVVILVTGVNKLRSVYKARQYKLDQYSAAAVRDWHKTRNPVHSTQTIPRFSVTLNDEGGDAISQISVMPTHARNLIDCCRNYPAKFGQNRQFLDSLIVAPWFDMSCERYTLANVKIPREAMPEIKSIKIEVEK